MKFILVTIIALLCLAVSVMAADATKEPTPVRLTKASLQELKNFKSITRGKGGKITVERNPAFTDDVLDDLLENTTEEGQAGELTKRSANSSTSGCFCICRLRFLGWLYFTCCYCG